MTVQADDNLFSSVRFNSGLNSEEVSLMSPIYIEECILVLKQVVLMQEWSEFRVFLIVELYCIIDYIEICSRDVYYTTKYSLV